MLSPSSAALLAAVAAALVDGGAAAYPRKHRSYMRHGARLAQLRAIEATLGYRPPRATLARLAGISRSSVTRVMW